MKASSRFESGWTIYVAALVLGIWISASPNVATSQIQGNNAVWAGGPDLNIPRCYHQPRMGVPYFSRSLREVGRFIRHISTSLFPPRI